MSNLARGKSGRLVNEASFQPPAAGLTPAFWGKIMLKQEKVGGGVSALGEFSATLFFLELRNDGCNPFIRDGAVYSQSGGAHAVRKWAAAHDPNGSLRTEYARARWATRAPGARVIELG